MGERYEVIEFPDAENEEHRAELHRLYPFVCKYWTEDKISNLRKAIQPGYLAREYTPSLIQRLLSRM